jgi:hypothetical protein
MYVFQYTVLYIIPSCLINSALDVLDVMIHIYKYDDVWWCIKFFKSCKYNIKDLPEYGESLSWFSWNETKIKKLATHWLLDII